MLKKIVGFYKQFMSDSLYRNSIYLMLSTLIMAALGFVAWIIIARFYTAEQIGLATTIISLMGLITNFSLLGIGTGLIRFLPKSENKNDKINTAIALIVLVTIATSTLFLLFINNLSPKLVFIRKDLIFSILFIVFMVFSSLNALIESIFIAYRSSWVILLKNSIFSFGKLLLPLFFIGLGAYGIFGSWMLSLMLGFLISFGILVFNFSYIPRLVFHDSVIKKIGRYSFGNYLAGFINSLPIMLIPLMITHYINAEATAYYYMAMMIAGVLFIIPQATANALFAEGSYDEKRIKLQISKSIKIIVLLLIPSIMITFLFGKYILLILGKAYSIEGSALLIILSVCSLLLSINSVLGSILRVKNKINYLIMINLTISLTIISISYYFMKYQSNILGIGYAWFAGYTISLIGYFIIFTTKRI